MGWELRAESRHRCEQPTRDAVFEIPSASLTPGALPIQHRETTIGGSLGDLWRCDGCQALWRVGLACDLCDLLGGGDPRGGQHTAGLSWRPATMWQRLTHWQRPPAQESRRPTP